MFTVQAVANYFLEKIDADYTLEKDDPNKRDIDLFKLMFLCYTAYVWYRCCGYNNNLFRAKMIITENGVVINDLYNEFKCWGIRTSLLGKRSCIIEYDLDSEVESIIYPTVTGEVYEPYEDQEDTAFNILNIVWNCFQSESSLNLWRYLTMRDVIFSLRFDDGWIIENKDIDTRRTPIITEILSMVSETFTYLPEGQVVKDLKAKNEQKLIDAKDKKDKKGKK